jgi:hypothetical protein
MRRHFILPILIGVIFFFAMSLTGPASHATMAMKKEVKQPTLAPNKKTSKTPTKTSPSHTPHTKTGHTSGPSHLCSNLSIERIFLKNCFLCLTLSNPPLAGNLTSRAYKTGALTISFKAPKHSASPPKTFTATLEKLDPHHLLNQHKNLTVNTHIRIPSPVTVTARFNKIPGDGNGGNKKLTKTLHPSPLCRPHTTPQTVRMGSKKKGAVTPSSSHGTTARIGRVHPLARPFDLSIERVYVRNTDGHLVILLKNTGGGLIPREAFQKGQISLSLVPTEKAKRPGERATALRRLSRRIPLSKVDPHQALNKALAHHEVRYDTGIPITLPTMVTVQVTGIKGDGTKGRKRFTYRYPPSGNRPMMAASSLKPKAMPKRPSGPRMVARRPLPKKGTSRAGTPLVARKGLKTPGASPSLPQGKMMQKIGTGQGVSPQGKNLQRLNREGPQYGKTRGRFIEITYPVGGEKIYPAYGFRVDWRLKDMENNADMFKIAIWLRKNGRNLKKLATVPASQTSYECPPSNEYPLGKHYQVSLTLLSKDDNRRIDYVHSGMVSFCKPELILSVHGFGGPYDDTVVISAEAHGPNNVSYGQDHFTLYYRVNRGNWQKIGRYPLPTESQRWRVPNVHQTCVVEFKGKWGCKLSPGSHAITYYASYTGPVFIGENYDDTENDLTPNAPPLFGTISLSSDFHPTPYHLSVAAGGPVEVSSYLSSGNNFYFTTAAPTILLDWSCSSAIPASSRTLHVQSSTSSRILIQTPSGDYVSPVDGNLEVARNGIYKIWVLSRSPFEITREDLYFSFRYLSNDIPFMGSDKVRSSADLVHGFRPQPFPIKSFNSIK